MSCFPVRLSRFHINPRTLVRQGVLSSLVLCLPLFGTEEQRLEEESRGRSFFEQLFKPRIIEADDITSPAKPPMTPPELQTVPAFADRVALINAIRIEGNSEDVLLFELLGSLERSGISLSEKLRQECIGKQLTREQIRQIAVRYTANELVSQGYLLAILIPEYEIDESGTLAFTASFGRVGTYRYADDPSFAGRYFSRRQIDKHWSQASDDLFNYFTFYEDAYILNSHPDLTVDTHIQVRTDPETNTRLADITLSPRESLPLHGTFRTGNYGQESAGRDRHALSLEYRNLTRHNDTLAVNYTAGEQPDEYDAVSGSYTLPFDFREQLVIRLFAGRSDTEVPDAIQDIDLIGEENFLGSQVSYKLISDLKRQLSVNLGRIWRKTTDRTLFLNVFETKTEIRTAPVDIGIDFYDKLPDAFGGRSFAGISWVTNVDGLDGTSSSSSFDELGVDDDYSITRYYLTRIQSLFSTDWTIAFQLSGQYTNDRLISSEQTSAGGIFSVRGYEEDILLTDVGYRATFELLTPAVTPNLGSMSTTFGTNIDCRMVAFWDYAYGRNQSSFINLVKEETIAGAGLGIRMNMTEHASLRFDYGWPLESIDGGNASGRGHVLLVIDI